MKIWGLGFWVQGLGFDYRPEPLNPTRRAVLASTLVSPLGSEFKDWEFGFDLLLLYYSQAQSSVMHKVYEL